MSKNVNGPWGCKETEMDNGATVVTDCTDTETAERVASMGIVVVTVEMVKGHGKRQWAREEHGQRVMGVDKDLC